MSNRRMHYYMVYVVFHIPIYNAHSIVKNVLVFIIVILSSVVSIPIIGTIVQVNVERRYRLHYIDVKFKVPTYNLYRSIKGSFILNIILSLLKTVTISIHNCVNAVNYEYKS